jgi:hypothetical protein
MLRNTNSYYAAEDIKLPARPSKPVTFDHNDPQSLRDHADNMEAWQIAYDAYKLEVARLSDERSLRRNELCSQLAYENNMIVPQASLLFNLAWEDGRPDGVDSVIDRFEQLVELIIHFNLAGK